MEKEQKLDWETYWEGLVEKKKLKGKILEMNQADASLGNTMQIEEICHQIFEDYKEWRQNLKAVKVEFLHIIDKIQGVHLQSSRIKELDSLLVKVVTK